LKKELLIALIFLLTTVVLTSIDVTADLSEGSSWQHVTTETLIILIGSIGSLALVRIIVRQYRYQIQLGKQSLELTRKDIEKYRKGSQAFLQGLSEQIDQQFNDWGFTHAEKEIAMLLIKGMSIIEISKVRQVKDKTIRQQCLPIYRKAGVTGRAELSAFFLEDLLLPVTTSSNTSSSVMEFE